MLKRPIIEKTHRLPRTAYQGEVTASITVCVLERKPLFADSAAVRSFVGILAGCASRWSCLVVYCFMPDHLHLVLHGDNPSADLWKMVLEFKQKTGYWLASHRPGVVWQKDFHDHVIRHGDDLAAHVRYVLDNPCRKGLVENWEDYPFKGAMGCRLEDVLGGLPL